MGWKLVHESSSSSGTTKVYQNEKGEVRIDSFMGDVRNPKEHDRVSLKTSNGGQLFGHDFDHKNKFNTETGKGMGPVKTKK